MAVTDLLYGAYERRLANGLDPARLPRHVGAIVDGNRRWAKGTGAQVDHGYQAGADKIAVACPFCSVMLHDGVTVRAQEAGEGALTLMGAGEAERLPRASEARTVYRCTPVTDGSV